ncbi:MAG TPA: FecR domain-containing protein [Opitutaceae bacterium]|nr:FecR domain-containing protein [Opitutaceae bacterium]
MAAEDEIADAAALWVARIDRGLSAAEQRGLEAWLGEDPRHWEQFAAMVGAWSAADRAGESPELRQLALASRRRSARPRWPWIAAGAAAAALMLGFWAARPRPAPAAAPSLSYGVVPADARTLTLADGSVVQLRTGGSLRADFTAGERRVVLERGEASFAVARSRGRPFVVSLGPVAVRDVGTVFEVRRVPGTIEILVTEGRVQIEGGEAGRPPLVPRLEAGGRAVLRLGADGRVAGVALDAPSAAEVDRALAWSRTWLVFDRTPLADAVDAFNRRNPERLTIGDPALRHLLLAGRFRADNVATFVRLLGETSDVKSEWRPDGTIALQPAR